MQGKEIYEYAVIRVMPRVERGEFVNVGIVLFCRTQQFLSASIEVNERRLLAMAPDLDLSALQAHLILIERTCQGQGPVGELGQADSFHWLTAPHSTIIQASPVHVGICQDPVAELDHLMNMLVRLPS